MGFPDGSAVKNPPAIQETHKGDSVRSVLALRKFPGQRSLVGLQSIGSQSDTTERLTLS